MAVEAEPDASVEWLTTPFSQQDLDSLMSLNSSLRLELLCLSGLWLKVPAATWSAWIGEYERCRHLELARPFPPKEFHDFHDPKKRLRPLAAWLAYRPNTLTVRWVRCQDKLRQLSCIRELGSGCRSKTLPDP